nr:neurofilament heavy polypeptide isoform X3 [Ipomoea batatas]
MASSLPVKGEASTRSEILLYALNDPNSLHEDVSLELLTQLLASLKKDSKDIMPIGKRLGEKVFADIALKLKPYLTQAVKSLDLSLHEYSKVVTSILEGTTIVVEHSSDHTLKNQLTVGSKAATALFNESSQACVHVMYLFFGIFKFES